MPSDAVAGHRCLAAVGPRLRVAGGMRLRLRVERNDGSIGFDGNGAAVMGSALWTDAESTSNLTACTWTVNNTAPQGDAVWSHPHGATDLAEHNQFVVDTARQGAETERWFAQCTVADGGLDVHVQG